MNDNEETVYASCVRGTTQLTLTKTVNGKYSIWHAPAPAEDGECYMGASWSDLFDTEEEASLAYEKLTGGKHE